MNTIKNIKRTLVTLAAIATLGTVSNAQVSGYVKVPYNIKEKSVLVEPNVFYNLPCGVNGYTFMQLTNQNGYYGKTFLKKKVLDTDIADLKAKVTLQHANKLFAKGGAGISIDAKFLPEGLNLSAGYLPAWFNKDGKFDGGTIDFYISADEKLGLPRGMKIETFGEWSTRTGNWTYGEFKIEQKIYKGLSLAYNPVLNPDGDAIPDIQHRIGALIKF